MPPLTKTFSSNISSQITEQNWNLCSYQTAHHRAFISLGGDYTPNADINIIYLCTVTDQDDLEIFQKSFDNLAAAILFLNRTYGHWKFQDHAQSSTGCGSCHAH